MRREWKILKDTKVWFDRLNYASVAEELLQEQIETYPNSNFEVVEISEEEIENYCNHAHGIGEDFDDS
jgi:hypothetical protein